MNTKAEIVQWCNTKFFDRVRVSGVVALEVNHIRFKMVSNWDDGIVDALFFKDRYYSELNELKLFARLAERSNVIIDVGANTGIYSIIARASNLNAQIYAFEPYLINSDRFEQNLILNGMETTIALVKKAVGKTEGTISLAVPDRDQICDVISADHEFSKRFYKKSVNFVAKNVEQTTLDCFLASLDAPHVDLIKIDVENYEINVLEGAVGLLKSQSPIILIEIFVDDVRIEFYNNVLKPLGYYCYMIFPFGIVRSRDLTKRESGRNFIFSKQKTHDAFTPFTDDIDIFSAISCPVSDHP